MYNEDKGTAAIYTGNTGLPSNVDDTMIDDANVVLKASGVAKGTASVVFVSIPNAFGAATTDYYAYIKHTSYTTETNEDNETTYVYSGKLADGTEIDLTATSPLTTTGIYTYTSANKVANGDLLSDVGDADATDGFVFADPLDVSGTLLEANGEYYNMTDDTLIVLISSDASDVDGNGGFVVLAEDSDGDLTNDVEAIYVTVYNAP